jgi:hypothetical protein
VVRLTGKLTKALLVSQTLTAAEMVAVFDGADKGIVKRHLETLELMGELTKSGRGKYALAK